jgi:acyl dehydratase
MWWPASAPRCTYTARARPRGDFRLDWSSQRCWEDVEEGQEVAAVAFPISVYRLVVEAGANRDFNSIHHNSEFARASGAPDMYANTGFLLGMWERTVREFIGLGGSIRRIAGFRMRRFNTVGQTVMVRGSVKSKRREGASALLELEIWSEVDGAVTVGPGTVTVAIPVRGR